MKFRYRKFQAESTPALGRKKYLSRPIIPVSLKYGPKTIRYEALIDSGADFNIFPSDLAIRLGIDIESGQLNPGRGITGQSIPIYFHQITLEIGGKSFTVRSGFAENISYNQGILGENGFFDHFKVNFDLSKGEIKIK